MGTAGKFLQIAVIVLLVSFLISCTPPAPTVSPSILDFGAVAVGSNKKLTLTLSSERRFCIDSVQYNFYPLTEHADFAIVAPLNEDAPFCAGPGTPLEIVVEFRPKTINPHDAVFDFVVSGVIVPNLSVSLRGRGTKQ